MSGHVSWDSALIADCCKHKAEGRSFEVGFALALRANPPRSRVDRDIVADVRGFCDDAWHGRRPALRGFSLEMLLASDRATEARSAGSFRVDTRLAA